MKKYGYQDLAKNPENNSFFVSSARNADLEVGN